MSQVIGLFRKNHSPPALTIEDPGFVDRWEKVRKILDEGDHVKIGLPFDGKSFYPQEKGETVEILKMLREAGYRFPERVIADIEEEGDSPLDNVT